MAGFDGFARRIAQRGADVPKQVTRVIRKMALAVDATIVLATPVDTGRARANWLTSLGAPTDAADMDAKDPSGSGAIAQSRSVIDQFEAGGDTSIIIQNNLPYINKLNDGDSAQAPAGFVEKAVAAGLRSLQGEKIVKD